MFFVFFSILTISVVCQSQLDSLLFACYPYQGNAGDSSGNMHNGTIYGVVPAANRNNLANSAYFFDGINDWIDMGNVLIVPNQSAITMAMWMYPTKINGAQNRNVGIHVGEKKVGHMALRMQSETVHHFQALLSDAYSNNTTWVRSNQPYIDSTWYFLVGVYTNDYVKLYLDGVLQTNSGGIGTGAALTDVPSTEDLKIGKLPVWNSPVPIHYFNGKIDDVRIYTRELSQSEITYLYQNNVSCFTDTTTNPNDTLLDGIANTHYELNSIQVYPNPVSSRLNISSELDFEVSLKIFNIHGVEVMNEIIIAAKFEYDISHLPNGIYMTHLNHGDSFVVKKIIIQH